MSQPIVLVTFYSRCGSTEKLALAAAVGAVQERALIRLRRVPDADPAKTIEQFSQCRETLVRMRKEYVAPGEADVLGADAIIIGVSEGTGPSSGEWRPYFDLLLKLHSEGKLSGKTAVAMGTESAVEAFSAAMLQLGFAVAPVTGVERATAEGRRIAAAARKPAPM
jgi:hypothetical protein